MRKTNFLVLFAALLALAGGCRDSQSPAPGSSPAPAPAVGAMGEPTEAQPHLPTLKLWLGAEVLDTELATTARQMQTGMMFRTNMEENAGMLFVFPQPHQTAFWMKNTLVPLSAAYIDPEGVILEIHPLQPYDTNAVVAATDRVQYVLETPQGWFDRHHLHPGMVIRTERGTLRATFFRDQ